MLTNFLSDTKGLSSNLKDGDECGVRWVEAKKKQEGEKVEEEAKRKKAKENKIRG